MFRKNIFSIERKLCYLGVVLLVAACGASALRAASDLAKASDTRASKPKSGSLPDPATRSRLVRAYGSLPLSFEANQGQSGVSGKPGLAGPQGAGQTAKLGH